MPEYENEISKVVLAQNNENKGETIAKIKEIAKKYFPNPYPSGYHHLEPTQQCIEKLAEDIVGCDIERPRGSHFRYYNDKLCINLVTRTGAGNWEEYEDFNNTVIKNKYCVHWSEDDMDRTYIDFYLNLKQYFEDIEIEFPPNPSEEDDFNIEII